MKGSLNNFTRKTRLWVAEDLARDELKLRVFNNYFLNGSVLMSGTSSCSKDYFLIFEGVVSGLPLLTIKVDGLSFPFEYKYFNEDFNVEGFFKDLVPNKFY